MCVPDAGINLPVNDIPKQLMTQQTIYSLGKYILRGEQPLTEDAQVLMDWCMDREIWHSLSLSFPRHAPLMGRVAHFWYQEFQAHRKFRGNSDIGFVLQVMLVRFESLGVLP